MTLPSLVQIFSYGLVDARSLPGGRFKNTYELLNLRALKFSYVAREGATKNVFICFAWVHFEFYSEYLPEVIHGLLSVECHRERPQDISAADDVLTWKAFRFIGPFWGESPVYYPHKKPSFFVVSVNKLWTNNRVADYLRWYDTHLTSLVCTRMPKKTMFVSIYSSYLDQHSSSRSMSRTEEPSHSFALYETIFFCNIQNWTLVAPHARTR